MSLKIPCAEIAAALVGGEPLAFKAYPDGSLTVIAPNGQKFRFSPEQVQAQADQLIPTPDKLAKKPDSPAALKKSRPKKAEMSSGQPPKE